MYTKFWLRNQRTPLCSECNLTTVLTVRKNWIWHNNWATTCDFQQCGILTSVDSDKPVQPSFKVRNSKWYSVSSLTFIEYSSDYQRLWSDCISEALLVAHTTLLEISCRGSYLFSRAWFTLCILMDFPLQIDTMGMGLPIVYFKGS